MRWKNQAIVAFDTETTGLSPFGGDRVIEFAAVTLRIGSDGRVSDVSEHSWLVNPGIPIPPTVTEITGINDGDVAKAPPFSAIAQDVFDLLAGTISVAHNYPFDLGFLSQEFARTDRGWPEPLAEIDTVDVSMKCFPDARSHRLMDVCKRLNVELTGAHRAANDAEACGRAFLELARIHEVEDDLQGMLEWANAIGRPPENGPLLVNEHGSVVFRDGEYAGEAVRDYPIHLAWMEKARVATDGEWGWRYPESSRRWIRRWLNVRGAGRIRPNPKTARPDDWVLDCCIADEQTTRR